MSEFTFNLNGLNISQAGGLPQIPAGLSKLDSALYIGTADTDLTYTGNDSIVWDRVNAERLKRGLSGLAEIGYPRPADDAVPAANTPAGSETFKIKGPPGMTLEQARAVFEQQVKTGGVVGFAPGDSLSAATQAADGLEAAKAQLGQTVAGLSGNLPNGVNLQTISASLGPAGSAAAGQIGAFATGAAAAINSLRVNSTGFSPSSLASSLSQVPGEINAALTRDGASIVNDIKSFAGGISGVVGKTVTTVSNVLKGTPVAGIGVADLSKAVTALGPLPGLDQNQVTATLAQAQKLAGQTFDQMTNSTGLGAFGINAAQLEKAGLVKPGTAAEFLSQGKNDLLDVLKSPTVWTGKDGVKTAQDFLGNPALQSKVQQSLMKNGLADLKQLGVPTDKMTPQALSGLATNAAKNVQDTFKWTQNSPDLPANVKAAFDNATVNGAFAVNLVENKVEEPVLKEKVVEPSENTVNSATVDAAASRVVGNDKVPSVVPDGADGSAKMAVITILRFVGDLAAQAEILFNTVDAFQKRSSITQDEWDTLNQEYQVVRATFNSRGKDLLNTAIEAVNALPNSPAKAKYISGINTAKGNATVFIEGMKKLKQFITDLANKIAT